MMQVRLKKHSLKFIAIFVSVFIWVYVVNSEKIKFEKTIYLDFILPTDMMFAIKPPLEVTFIIEGPRAFVRTVLDREDRIVVDLNKTNSKRETQFDIEVNPAQLELPFGMKVDKVLPKKLAIKLEKKASKIVPIKIQFSGQFSDKISLQNLVLEPAEVEVYGPRSLILSLKELPTRPIELSSLPGYEQVPVEIQLPDDRLSLLSGLGIKLNYQLKASTSNFTLKSLPIRFFSEKQKISSLVKFADVKLLIPEKVLKNRSNVSSSVQVWADVPEKSKGRVEVPLKVVHPPTMQLLDISPKTIIVNIQ
jgi:YbbR domain-containing protein